MNEWFFYCNYYTNFNWQSSSYPSSYCYFLSGIARQKKVNKFTNISVCNLLATYCKKHILFIRIIKKCTIEWIRLPLFIFSFFVNICTLELTNRLWVAAFTAPQSWFVNFSSLLTFVSVMDDGLDVSTVIASLCSLWL